MNTVRDMAMIAVGMTGMYMFQKYKGPVRKAMKKAIDKEAKMMNDMLEDMM